MKTIVVRLPRNAAGTALEGLTRAFGHASLGPREELASVAQEAKILVEDLSERDRQDLETSSEFVTADPIPLTLIEPRNRSIDGGTSAHDAFIVDDGQGGKAAWGVVAVGAAQSAFNGRDVSVAVLDTGIDLNHPAFADPALNIVERNFTAEGDGDRDGHGTHCAGTIFGRDVEGIRIGIAPGVTQAFIAKVIPGDSADLAMALNWVFDSGAKVASMSLGYDFPGWVVRLQEQFGIPGPAAVSRGLNDFRANIATFDAIMNLFRARSLAGGGTVVVAATGNESARRIARPYTIAVSPPAAAMDVVAVGALERSPAGLEVAEFSNTHPQVCAPGVGVLSARAGSPGLVPFDGTSMATPHVAGLAALYWDQLLHQGGGQLRAQTVVNRLAGRASTAALAPGFSSVDVGDGMPGAP